MASSKAYQVIKRYFSDKPVKKVQVFGSFARNEANEKSDIDLIITRIARKFYYTNSPFL